MKSPERIAFVISDLHMGGAQRALSILASGFARRGREVFILTFAAQGTEPFFPLMPNVTVYNLDLMAQSRSPFSGLSHNLGRVRVLRRFLSELAPGLVVGFMDATNILTILAATSLRIPVIACERTDPQQYEIKRVWRALRAIVYPLATSVCVQTQAVHSRLPWPIRRKAEVVPNPVVSDCAPPEGTPFPLALPRPSLVAMGRLAPEKGFDILLEAFSRAAHNHPAWTLTIVGEGPERQRLEALAVKLAISERVLFPGLIMQPEQILRQADMFVLSSRFEGFPNALCEALACGVPAVAVDCPSGPAEILRHEVDGLLVPLGDQQALVQALSRLMTDDVLRNAMSIRAREISDRIGVDKVLDMWEYLFLKSMGRIPT